MKNLLLIIATLFCFNLTSMATKAAAAQRYRVTITTQITYHYFENNVEVATSNAAGAAQVIEVWADTPYEAERQAINECSSMCQNSWKDEGYRTYGGKRYQCTSEKSVYQVTKIEPLTY